ncbi:hypothetical protein NQ318_020657 [Aromia moschata]|uniref:Uncharacterized protein n=1 Tax=Aromia moschata TaxID=1265417 RepID=A0AAV8X938_9CUCU|nr:hypothetical protein NQ318_020657 [Aromia moschata]
MYTVCVKPTSASYEKGQTEVRRQIRSNRTRIKDKNFEELATPELPAAANAPENADHYMYNKIALYQKMPSNKRIAVWMSDKKLQKVNWHEFEAVCDSYGFEPFRLDLNRSLESQEPFCVLLHKLTDIIASANQGDIGSFSKINEVEKYIARNPMLLVIDPLPNVRKLLDRYSSYSVIHSTDLCTYNVFTPNFCILRSNDMDVLRQQLKIAKVTYPFICKPILGHGSRKAHEMSIIFNEKCLLDCRTPAWLRVL